MLDHTNYSQDRYCELYSSIYTHTIPWALHGREEALRDKEYKLLGNRIDRLLQYANDARTNGIAVGPALTDLIAEIILSRVDVEVSRRVVKKSIDFAAARFKDDYRILCQTEKDGQLILQIIADVLAEYNLVLNEKKTVILRLPDGIYRAHDREYFPYSLKSNKRIRFRVFEHTLLIVLDIHRRFPGTSILEKFISELFRKDKSLKVTFSRNESRRFQEIKKMIELLFFAKRESQKILCHVLAVCEQLYLAHRMQFSELKEYLADRVKYELKLASSNGSTFEVVWYIFFARKVRLGIPSFAPLVDNDSVKNNVFYRSIVASQQKVFRDSQIVLFIKPKDCSGESIAQQIAVFD